MYTSFNFIHLSKKFYQSSPLMLVMLSGVALVLINDPKSSAITSLIVGCLGIALLFSKLISGLKDKASRTHEINTIEMA